MIVCAGVMWLRTPTRRVPVSIEGICLGDTRAQVRRVWTLVSSPRRSIQVFKRSEKSVLVTFLMDKVVTVEGSALGIGGHCIRVGMSQSQVHQFLGAPTKFAPSLRDKAIPGRDLPTEEYTRTGILGFNTVGIAVEYEGDKVRNMRLSGVD